jgi:guanylate kinase
MKFIVVSAPSGAGKSTIVDQLVAQDERLCYSISTCTRAKRATVEKDGKDYNFVSPNKFAEMIRTDQFLEWEEVYPGEYYGTPRSELTRITGLGKVPIMILDVVGGANVKEVYGDSVKTVFIKTADLGTLEERLRLRGTETEESITARVTKATLELAYESGFDNVVVNDDLETALQEVRDIVEEYIGGENNASLKEQ